MIQVSIVQKWKCWYCHRFNLFPTKYRGQKFMECLHCGATTVDKLPQGEMPNLPPVTLAHIRWMKELELRRSSGNVL